MKKQMLRRKFCERHPRSAHAQAQHPARASRVTIHAHRIATGESDHLHFTTCQSQAPFPHRPMSRRVKHATQSCRAQLSMSAPRAAITITTASPPHPHRVRYSDRKSGPHKKRRPAPPLFRLLPPPPLLPRFPTLIPAQRCPRSSPPLRPAPTASSSRTATASRPPPPSRRRPRTSGSSPPATCACPLAPGPLPWPPRRGRPRLRWRRRRTPPTTSGPSSRSPSPRTPATEVCRQQHSLG